jgi:hypothetical protein
LFSRWFGGYRTGFTAYCIIVIDTNALLMQQLSLDICLAQNWAKYITAGWPIELNKKKHFSLSALQLVSKQPKVTLGFFGSDLNSPFADQLTG